MLIVHAKRGDVISLGREGENLARQVVFDIYEWQEIYGDGTVQLLAQRMGDAAPYPCAIEMDGNHAVWTITSADTARPGKYGKCELSYFVGETLVKSETFVTIVLDALGEPTEEPPEPYQAWVDKVLAAGTDAEAAADRAETASVRQPTIGENGNWWVWDAAAGEYVDTGVASGAVQPDMEQNDEAATDYIKNRPIHKDADGYVVIADDYAKALAALSPQPDWEQNDDTALDHIKNRPLYPTVLDGQLLLEEQTVAMEDYGDGIINASLSGNFVPKVGYKYTVTFDGVAYECVAYAFKGYGSGYAITHVALGNEDLAALELPDHVAQGGGNGEPFGFLHSFEDGWSGIYTSTPGEHTIGVTGQDDGIAIQEEYLNAIKAALPTVELTATLEDGTTQTYKLYGEAVTE